MNKITKLPIAIGGLSLSLFALGNAIEEYLPIMRYFLGGIAFLLYLMLLISLMSHFKAYKKELHNPVVASIFPTLFMQGMLLDTYSTLLPTSLKFLIPIFNFIWWGSFLGQLLYIILFSLYFLKNFDLKNVFPSWAVLYLGIGVVSLTAPITGYYNLGRIVFWYLFIVIFILLPLVFLRLYKFGIPNSIKTNIATLCAPSLVVVAYLNTFEEVNKLLLLFLILLAQSLYFGVLYYLPKLISDNFTPAFSALTFPLVISAVALKGTLLNFSFHSILCPLFYFEFLVAILVIIRVSIGYVNYFIKHL
ncbi:TDT family transporter [Streptococcus equinus]|uniref:TDT family transporter n=1 Tax=Streptococcus equinus TaxID=1335 RepID=UPI00088FB8A2|nr:TDT family transporter [Streptococcus equinus]SDI57840.1 exfoliative toxin A/B [Streptococcus equinus]SEP69580.1 exfoliative toxin A/B [Streptococcus equinus]